MSKGNSLNSEVSVVRKNTKAGSTLVRDKFEAATSYHLDSMAHRKRLVNEGVQDLAIGILFFVFTIKKDGPLATPERSS